MGDNLCRNTHKNIVKDEREKLNDHEHQNRLAEQRNSDENSRDQEESTVLMKSARNDHNVTEVIQYFTGLSTDVNTICSSRVSALIAAAQDGHLEIVRYLAEQLHVDTVVKNIALSAAARNGHPDVVRYLLGRLSDGPLIEAVENGHFDVVRHLVKFGANVHVKNDAGDPVVMKAAENGHYDVFRYLVECGVNVNVKNDVGDTVLMKASDGGNIRIVKFLAEESNVDVNARNNNGQTALLLAANFGHVGIMQCLIPVGADLAATDENGRNVLMVAAYNDKLDVVRYLIECVWDVNPNRNTTIMPAAKWGHVGTVQHDTKYNMYLNIVDKNGYTALMWAAERGHVHVVQLLTQSGADLNITSHGNHTALMKATMNQHVDVAQFLVESGTDTNIPDEFGYTALLRAVENGCIEIVRHIVEKGRADVNAKDKKRETALIKAARNNHIDVVLFLVAHKADGNATDDREFTALMLAAKWGQLELVRCIADQPGADVNVCNLYGSTALMKAALNGHCETVRYLGGQCGADVNAPDNTGDTALTLAAERGHAEVVRYLAEDRGANVNSNNNDGVTALMWAAARGYIKIVRYLTEHDDTDMNIADNYGSTALMKAVTNEHTEIVQYLVNEGKVNVNVINNRGETAYQLAYNRGHQEIQRILKSIPVQMCADDTAESAIILSTQFCSLIPPSEITLVSLCQNENIGGEYRAKWLDGDAVVKLYIPEATYSAFEEEVRLWQSLRHPNVIKMYGACYPGPRLYFFVCEYASNGSLIEFREKSILRSDTSVPNELERIAKVTSSTWKLLHEAALGLAYLHEREVAHGDLRCSNILIESDGLAKLSNFRLCGYTDKSMVVPSRLVGSMRWQSPEVIKGEQLSFASDVYSLGMCILEAVTVNVPCCGRGESLIRLDKMRWDPHDWKNTSDFGPKCPSGDVHDLVWRMCCLNPKERPSLFSIVYELEKLSTKEIFSCSEPDSENSFEEYKFGKLSNVWNKVKTSMENCDNEQQSRIYQMLIKVRIVVEKSPNPTLLTKLYVFLTEFHENIKMSPQESLMAHTSAARGATKKSSELYRRIHFFLKTLQGSMDKSRERNEQWQQQLNDIIMSGVSGNDRLLLDLKSPEDKSIVLKALKSEMRNSQLKYTSDQLAAKDVAYKTIASEIDIDNLMPEWFIPRYELIIDECSELGKGGFGSVYQAKWLDSDVVVKQVLLAGDDQDSPDYSCSSFSASQVVQSTQTNDMERVQALMMFRREVDIWFGLNHPHIIHIFGACHVGKPFFFCEHATNGTMVKYLQKYPDQLWVKLYEAALGVQYLHARGIVHADLNGNNIVIGSDMKAKVADFGLSSIAKNDGDKPQISAALRWLAPECFPDENTKTNEQGTKRATFESDVYSLGMCIVEALHVVESVASVKRGNVPQPCMPWGRLEDVVVKHYVLRGILPAQPTTCEHYHWDLVRRMCGFDPQKRIKISVVVDELVRFANISDKYAVSMYSPPAKFVDLEYIPQLISADRSLLSRLRNASEGNKLVLDLYTSLWDQLEMILILAGFHGILTKLGYDLFIL